MLMLVFCVLFFLFSGITQEVPWRVQVKTTSMVLAPNRAQLFLTNLFFFIMIRSWLQGEDQQPEILMSTTRPDTGLCCVQPRPALWGPLNGNKGLSVNQIEAKLSRTKPVSSKLLTFNTHSPFPKVPLEFHYRVALPCWGGCLVFL